GGGGGAGGGGGRGGGGSGGANGGGERCPPPAGRARPDGRCFSPAPTPCRGRRPSARSRRYCAPPRLHSRRHSTRVELGSVFHRLDDFHVAGAAANVAAERRADVVLARMRIAPQQASRRHDESRRAVAALRAELLVEPTLHRRKTAVLPERFDCVDALTIHAGGERETR